MAPTRGSTPTPPGGPTPGGPTPGGPTPGGPVPPGLEPAGFGRRFAALLIDWLLSVLLSTVFADPRAAGWPPVAVLILEYALFIGLFGQTPGMAIARLRCISVTDGGAIGIPRALLRGLLLALLIPALIMDDRRRGLHDKAANSIVVAAPPRPAR